MTVRDAIQWVQEIIQPAALEEAQIQSKDLVSHVLGISRSRLFGRYQDSLTAEQEKELDSLARMREQGKPLQYLIGEWAFMGFPFRVCPSVLIPRPETELLCEAAACRIKESGFGNCLDLCCGSGCIGISLHKMTGICVTLSDISDAALRVAAENAARLHADVEIIRSDLFSEIPGKYDLIVCNPPYLSEREMQDRQRELLYEPEIAFQGGRDGLDFYRRISDQYQEHLHPKGVLMLEIGASQSDAVCGILPVKEIRKDYAGLPRLAIIENE